MLWVNIILAAQPWPASGLAAWTVDANVVADTVDRIIACVSITSTSIVVFMYRHILKAVYKQYEDIVAWDDAKLVHSILYQKINGKIVSIL